MDEYANEVEEEIVEEEYEEGDVVEEVEEEQTEQQRAEAADVVKLFKQHPEIWIPYEEQIQERLIIKPADDVVAPGAEVLSADMVTSLRDISLLDANHTTYPFLTNYEKTKCISFRASQINNGAKPYILVPTGVNDSYQIAKMELEARRLPFIVKRPMPDGTYEVWRLNDLLVL
jgi:DNA-directed RNA polymerase I, II, and III subunit RPABC2